MTQESAEPGLLAALGHVDPPPAAVLDAAREVLWSAVAQEMLATAPASGQVTGAASGQATGVGQTESAPDRTGRQTDGRSDDRASQPPDSGA